MSFKLEGKVIFFATNNINKFNEARKVLGDYSIATAMLRVKTLETQNDGLREIAIASVTDAFGKCHLPVIVEDAGLFIEALNGFPGPYAAYAYKTIGNRGLLKLMESTKNRNARFQSVIAYNSSKLKQPTCFAGEVLGEMTREERRKSAESGFGFDPIFRPEDCNKTFAEMSMVEKNRHSHRASALRKFGEWYGRLV